MRIPLITSCWLVACVGGCNVGNPIPTREYSAFVWRSGASYAGDRDGGEVSIWFSPQRYGYEIQGLSIKNVLAPEGSEVDVSNPSSAKGEQWMILTVHNVKTAKTNWRITWDVYQGMECKQRVQVIIAPPPEVKIMIDGQEVGTSRAPG
jgi:hypothetical protein